MRVSKRKNVPFKVAGTRFAKADHGNCSRCGKPALRRVFNVYRESYICGDADCVEQETAWVGNMPLVKRKERSTAPALARKVVPKHDQRVMVESPHRRRFDVGLRPAKNP